MITVFAGLGVALVCLFMRILIVWGSKGFGCDAFYFLTCRRAFLKNKKIPILLHNYILDIDEQWYPPFFTFFLCLIPEKILHTYHWLISPLIEVIHCIVLMFIVLVSTQSVSAMVIGGLLYALTPTLITESMSMNVRPLSALIFTSVMLFLFAYLNNPTYIILAGLMVSLIVLILTHKLSVQCIVVVFMMLSLVYGRLTPIIYFIIVSGVVFALFRSFYIKMIKGNIEILFFWIKNLHNLGAHQYYDSSLYKKECPDTRLYQPGFKGLLKLVKIIIGYNPLIMVLGILFFQKFIVFNQFMWFSFFWIIGVYVMVVATTFIKPLRFLGEGWKYIKYSIFPNIIILILIISSLNNFYFLFVSITLCLLLLTVDILLIGKMKKSISGGKIDESFIRMIDYIKQSSIDRIMCIPTHLCDALVYYADKKVLWGTHSSKYELIEELFPVIKKPIEYFVNTYDLKAILINEKYFSYKEYLKDYTLIHAENEYHLIILNNKIDLISITLGAQGKQDM